MAIFTTYSARFITLRSTACWDDYIIVSNTSNMSREWWNTFFIWYPACRSVRQIVGNDGRVPHIASRVSWSSIRYMSQVWLMQLYRNCTQEAVSIWDSPHQRLGRWKVSQESTHKVLQTLLFFNMCLPCFSLLFFIYELHAFSSRLTCLYTHINLIFTIWTTCVHCKANTCSLPI